MVWDTENWKKVARDLKVEYSKLHPSEYPPVSTLVSGCTSSLIILRHNTDQPTLSLP